MNVPLQKAREYHTLLRPNILDTYQQLVSSRYFTASHLEQIAQMSNQAIEKQNEDVLLSTLVYMKGILTFALNRSTFSEFERRFDHFFTTQIDKITALVSKSFSTVTDDQHQGFINLLIEYICRDREKLESPWPRLLIQVLPHYSDTQVMDMHVQIESRLSVSADQLSPPAALAFSYLLVRLKKSDSGLSLLYKHCDHLYPQDLEPHFELFKQEKSWEDIQNWLKVLFPKRKEGSFGYLQPFVDEMNAILTKNTKQLTELWNRWLNSPNFQRYLALTRHLDQESKQALVKDQLLPTLTQKLYQPETLSVYARLLIDTKDYQGGTHLLLRYVQDPLRLKPELTELMQLLEQESFMLIRPVYHQFVVRLAEKKTRAHYQQAAIYIRCLKKNYAASNEEALFLTYIDKMKKTYRTYRAFVEELKKID